jgi:cbb3-type cytochrome oxidase subunit 3
MKLSDVVSGMHLSIFAEVPLLIFMGVFIGVCLNMLRRGEQFQSAAQLPLRQETPPNRSAR